MFYLTQSLILWLTHPGIPEVRKMATRKVTTIPDFYNPSAFRKEVNFRNT